MFNSKFDLYKNEWLELVFKNRNQNYGAYVLRKEASVILLQSLAAAVLIVALFILPSRILSNFNQDIIIDKKNNTTEIIPVTILDKSLEKPKVELPASQNIIAKVRVKTVAVSSNIVVTDRPALPPPTLVEMQNSVIGLSAIDGEFDDDQIIGSQIKELGEVLGTVKSTDEILDINAGGVDEYPEFIGGMSNFGKYIQRNLKYPVKAQDENIQGKVIVSFVVERDGTISNVSLLRGLGFGLDDEALRVIQKSPKWKPGMNKGIPVRVRYQVPINFTIAS